jgi:hypothetical protein
MKTLVITFTLFLAAVCNGLAQTNSAVPAPGSQPTKLAHLIANADHIIVTNRSVPRYRGFSISISGPRVGQIVRAVSSATRNQAETNSEWDWEIQFFKGTNRLAVVNFQGSMFLAENGEYHDGSGELKKLESEISIRTTRPEER